METDARVTTAIVGLLIAFCALLLFKWLAVVALVALVLIGVLRFTLRRVVRARRAARTTDPSGIPVTPVSSPASGPAAAAPTGTGLDCSWCGLHGGHRDLRGRAVRPRHAHALPGLVHLRRT